MTMALAQGYFYFCVEYGRVVQRRHTCTGILCVPTPHKTYIQDLQECVESQHNVSQGAALLELGVKGLTQGGNGSINFEAWGFEPVILQSLSRA